MSDTLTLDDLQAAPYNPRTISAKALGALARSLERFGNIAGITYNRTTGHLVAGHQRVKALRKAHGRDLRVEGSDIVTPSGERFPVRVVEWDEPTEKAACIAANAEPLQGRWSDVLGALLAEVAADLPGLVEELRLDKLRVPDPAALFAFAVHRKVCVLSNLSPGFGLACASWKRPKDGDVEADDTYQRFLAWKAAPSEHRDLTAEMARDLVALVDRWSNGWRGFVLTVPPQGASRGKEYPAGVLGKAVAVELGVDFVTLFAPDTTKAKYHHPQRSLEAGLEPATLAMEVPGPVVIVDDCLTSGCTLRRAMLGLAGRACWAFVWCRNSQRS